MKCDYCDREASVHLTQIINNKKVVLNLCKECAAKRGFHSPLDNIPFPLSNFLSGLVSQEESKKDRNAVVPTDLVCPNCGLTFEEFSRLGRFGCGQCYKTFRTKLQGLLRKIHGSSLHRGKLPPLLSEEGNTIKEQERLQEELQAAIAAEDFERAADLRDKIKSLNANNEKEENMQESREKENV
jgi:protein arginine kinase activator